MQDIGPPNGAETTKGAKKSREMAQEKEAYNVVIAEDAVYTFRSLRSIMSGHFRKMTTHYGPI